MFFEFTAWLTASTRDSLGSSSMSFSTITSQVKWFRSFFPLDQGECAAVSLSDKSYLAATAFIAGFLNSPPLSAKIPFARIPGPSRTHLLLNAVIMVSGSLFGITSPTIKPQNSSQIYKIYYRNLFSLSNPLTQLHWLYWLWASLLLAVVE